MTLGTFPLVLYWYTELYVLFLFDKVSEKNYQKLVKKIKDKVSQIEHELSDKRLEHHMLHEETDDEECLLDVKVSSPKQDLQKEFELLKNSISHITVENDKGEIEVCDLQISLKSFDTIGVFFEHRFINFRLNFEANRFEPVVFDCIQSP